MRYLKIFALLLFSFPLTAQVNLTNGLMLYLPFNGNTNDASGNNNNATNYGAQLTSGSTNLPNTAYYFDGIASYMQVVNNATINFPNDSFSLYALIKPQGYYLGPCHGNSVIDKGNGDFIPGWYTLRFSDSYSSSFTNCSSPVNTLTQNFYPQSNGLTLSGNGYLPYMVLNDWICLIAISDGISLKGYVNGTLTSIQYYNSTIGTNTDVLTIGRKNSTQFPYWYHGVIDEIRIYNRAINIQEVEALCMCNSGGLLVSALSTDSNICINDSTTLFGQGASTYSWSNGVINGVPFYPSSTATYTVTGTDANGCTATSTITINVNSLPIVNAIANPQNICSNNPVTLNGSGALNYTWTGSVVNGIPFTPTVAGSYTVTGTDANGCSNTSSIAISINPNPIISGSVNPPIICQGAQTTFNGSGGVTYTWSGGVINGVPFYPNTSGNYTVTGTDANGCTGTSVVAITVLPKPTINANANPPIICNGQSTTLTGSGGVSYTWSGTIIDGTPFQPSSTATYTVTGTDANGCSNTSTTSITVIQNIALTISPNNPSLCEGDSILLTASGAANYFWTSTPGLSNYNGASVWAHPNTSTTFTVNATDANGCSGTATINVVVDKDIEITATKNQDAECNVNLIQLRASGANNYTWSPSNLLSNPNGSVTNATINETTTFLVTGTSGACSDTDSVTVNYLIKNNIGTNIPNAFSPNYDGMNDCLHVITNEVYASFYFTIYNRWGEKIYETNDQNNCWEGFYKNQRAPVGTYFYYLRAKSRCGDIFKKGDFILIR